MNSLILFISADFLLHSGQEKHCLHLEKAFHWWEPLQSLSDANELNSGPDGSGNLLICHTTQHNTTRIIIFIIVTFSNISKQWHDRIFDCTQPPKKMEKYWFSGKQIGGAPVFSIFRFMAIIGVLELNIIQAIYGT